MAGNGTAAERVASALAPKTITAKANDSSSATGNDSTSTSASTDNSTITANDFLTLLVSELKNQDPTQPTDPSAYIQQLVGVNSLQQLIQINKGLSTFESAITG
ncbi:MAG: flagellar hook capping protein [Acidobacteria bacterium]|nr:flagellar hook capping protein [Acidobacteriota bacterium]